MRQEKTPFVPHEEIEFVNKLGQPDVLDITRGPNTSKISRRSDGMVLESGGRARAEELVAKGKV